MKKRVSGFVENELKQSGITSVVISAQGGGVLTKQQKEFNRLTKRIESLRKELKDMVVTLDAHLNYYGEHIHPLEVDLIAAKREHLKLLVPYVTEKNKLTKNEKAALKEYASGILDDVLALMGCEPDEELKTMFQVLYNRNFDEVQAEQMASVKGELEDLFEEMGYDIDLGEFGAKMKPEDLAAKMAELRNQFEAKAEAEKNKQANKKKTKRQLAQELKEQQKEEARKKNISSVYRQLAKILHPDLESDTSLKIVKEEVMKQLTIAYENNDLHMLLRLEMEWMEKQAQNIDKITDEKLSVYNSVLKEQMRELEFEVETVSDHPRYMPLFRIMDYETLINSKTIAHKKYELLDILKAIHDTIRIELRGNSPLLYLKGIAQNHIQERKYQKKMEKLFDNLMGF